MKKGKRSCLILLMLVSLLLSSNAYGAEVTKESLAEHENLQETYQIEPRAEQVRWYYRIYKGVPQKRLWSITYGRWKTDWISR